MTDTSHHLAVIGAGPAGLMAAEAAARVPGLRVTVFDRMPSAGRKLLMAGRGGLNLTHSEPLEAFLARYRERAIALRPFIDALTPEDLRAWAEALGQETFVGSSGRVFPKAMKASGLLRAWLRRLDAQDVALRTRHRWTGWDDAGRLTFDTPEGPATVAADATTLALGGASWPRLGADGGWVALLEALGIGIAPLQPSNCGVNIAWSGQFRARFEGAPLKGIGLTHGTQNLRGEAVVTATGLEGGAVYALSAPLRDALVADGKASITIDLKPDVMLAALARRLDRPRAKQSVASFLRKSANLPPVAIGLLQEAAHRNAKPLGDMPPETLAAAIKAVPLTVTGLAGMDKAISSAGGVPFEALDTGLMLRARPGVFVAGEMIDWEAPTGGYLLQACFATGAAAGRAAAAWLMAD